MYSYVHQRTLSCIFWPIYNASAQQPIVLATVIRSLTFLYLPPEQQNPQFNPLRSQCIEFLTLYTLSHEHNLPTTWLHRKSVWSRHMQLHWAQARYRHWLSQPKCALLHRHVHYSSFTCHLSDVHHYLTYRAWSFNFWSEPWQRRPKPHPTTTRQNFCSSNPSLHSIGLLVHLLRGNTVIILAHSRHRDFLNCMTKCCAVE